MWVQADSTSISPVLADRNSALGLLNKCFLSFFSTLLELHLKIFFFHFLGIQTKMANDMRWEVDFFPLPLLQTCNKGELTNRKWLISTSKWVVVNLQMASRPPATFCQQRISCQSNKHFYCSASLYSSQTYYHWNRVGS